MNHADMLATIRRAYRYVVAYERRVLDSIDQIDEALRPVGLEFRKPRQPLYTDFPTKGFAPHCWAWDEVPGFACRYQWSIGEENTRGNRWVVVDHVADTAFESWNLERTRGGEPDPLSDLPEDSRSILRFFVVGFDGPLLDEEYDRYWQDLLARHFEICVAELYPASSTAAPVVRRRPPLVLFTHCVDLMELAGPEALRLRFIEPLMASLSDGTFLGAAASGQV